MSTYNSSPLLMNPQQHRRSYEYASPQTRWGAPAGRLNYFSPLNMSNQMKVEAAASRSLKGIYSSSDDSIGSPNFANPRITYGSPGGSPISQRTLNASSDRSRTFSEFADSTSHIHSSISRMIQEDSADVSSGSRSDSHGGHRHQARTTLPSWTLDGNGQIRLTLPEILQYNQLKMFARDKLGCQFLQQNYPVEGTAERQKLCQTVLENEEVFEALCSDVFGNFFVQRIIEMANIIEQRWVSSRLHNKMNELCLNRYSCRVVQKAIEQLPLDLKGPLLVELHNADIVRLSIDQNANHVIQKIMHCFPLNNWAFIIDGLTQKQENLFSVAENKYGCRVVQLAIEMLSTQKKSRAAEILLDSIMVHVTRNCERLASNEFANYVIQHIITAGPLSDYRDRIINECILRNILSMSQEKYASHVVEKSLEYAPPPLLKEMMDEIFEGYVPHPETKKDALDIMLFHQYGNYVVQRMLSTCVEAARAYVNGINLQDMESRLEWLHKLSERILQCEGKLGKYSSGKKILEMLAECPPVRKGPLESLEALAASLPQTLPSTFHGHPAAIPHGYM